MVCLVQRICVYGGVSDILVAFVVIFEESVGFGLRHHALVGIVSVLLLYLVEC